jgi:hypothetical protein
MDRGIDGASAPEAAFSVFSLPRAQCGERKERPEAKALSIYSHF